MPHQQYRQPIWETPSHQPSSHYEASGNGGSHGDLRERVRALEVRADTSHDSALEWMRATAERMSGLDRRLEEGDRRMSGLQSRCTQHDAEITRLTGALTPLAAAVEENTKWREARAAEQASRAQAVVNRRAARKEALVLLQWAAALVLLAAYAVGAIPHDKIEGLIKLRSLIP